MSHDLGEDNLRLLEASRKAGPTLLADQANKAVIDQVKAETPSQFTVGGSFDGHTVTGGVTIDRKWSNGFGATAYIRAWYNDSAVIPRDKHGIVAGGEFTKTF
jgi:hypothetical protein